MTISTQAALKNYTDCGIYTITHNASGKIYVGSSKVIIKRKSRHFRTLIKNKHTNDYLQAAYNKYGDGAFTFKVVLVCPPEDRIFHEQRLIDQHRSSEREFGYNGSSTAGVTELTAETRAKMSRARMGVAPWNKGIPHSEESKKKMRESQMIASQTRPIWNKGKPWSEEMKKKLSEAHMGFYMPEAQKRKISEANKGKNTWSRGRKLSTEHIAKVASANTKTHCKRGHAMTADNLDLSPRGERKCSSCRRFRANKRHQDNKIGGATP